MASLEIEEGAVYIFAYYKDPVQLDRHGKPPVHEHIQYALAYAYSSSDLKLFLVTSNDDELNLWKIVMQDVHTVAEGLLHPHRAVALLRLAEPGSVPKWCLPRSSGDTFMKTLAIVDGKRDYAERPHFIKHYGMRFAVRLASIIIPSIDPALTVERWLLDIRLAVGEALLYQWPRQCVLRLPKFGNTSLMHSI